MTFLIPIQNEFISLTSYEMEIFNALDVIVDCHKTSCVYKTYSSNVNFCNSNWKYVWKQLMRKHRLGLPNKIFRNEFNFIISMTHSCVKITVFYMKIRFSTILYALNYENSILCIKLLDF